MESDKFGGGNEKLEFRQIVLGHIKKILEISSHELRDTTRQIAMANQTQIIEQEDTRYSYIQAIENFAYILMPYFDDKMMKVYVKSAWVINAYEFELTKYFRDEIIKVCKETGKTEIPHVYFIDKRIEYAKKLFVELNRLLKRVDYLKNVIYGEDVNSEEVVEEEKEEGEE